MIIEALMTILVSFINFIINLLPYNVDASVGALNSFFDLLGFGIYIIGPNTFLILISSFIAWFLIQMSWAVIEWIYKKIPGIN